jgi:glycosyltransferase involved in cell wall biosynthesis
MRQRVCLVGATSGAADGGLLADCVRALLSQGWDARLLWMQKPGAANPSSSDPALAPNVELRPRRYWHPPPPALLRHPAMLRRYLRADGEVGPFDQPLLRLRPDLIHFHSGRDARQALRLKRFLDCRVLVSLHADGRELEEPDLERLWREADLIVVPDTPLRDRALARGCPPQKVEVLPIPLRRPQAKTEGLEPKPEVLRIVSAGPLTWEQGFEHSVHAVRLLLDMGIDCHYRILGEGEYLYPVGFARHQLGLAESVELLPANGVPLEDELRKADVYVDPAVRSPVPAAPLALAHAVGLPFVATERPGLPEDAGVRVRRRSPQEIAAALATLAGDSALRRRMAEASRAHSAAYPTLPDHVHRLEELYRGNAR